MALSWQKNFRVLRERGSLFSMHYFSIMPEMTICWTWVLPS